MDRNEIESVLAGVRIGRLAMADSAGRPYVIPLPFCWFEGALYLRLPMSGRKGAVLRENNQVCFEADVYDDLLVDYASVLIEGRLVPVTALNEKQRVKAANGLKYERLRNGHRPGHGRSTPLGELPLCKIQVCALSGRKKAPECARIEVGA